MRTLNDISKVHVENIRDFEQLHVAKEVFEIADYFFEFALYFAKVLELVIEYTKKASTESPNDWIDTKIREYPYIGMAEFINQYIDKQQEMFEKTDGFYLLLDDKICALQLTCYRTNEQVMIAGNTYHLMLGGYYDSDCTEQILEKFKLVLNNLNDTTEGMVALRNLSQKIMRDKKAELN